MQIDGTGFVTDPSTIHSLGIENRQFLIYPRFMRDIRDDGPQVEIFVNENVIKEKMYDISDIDNEIEGKGAR